MAKTRRYAAVSCFSEMMEASSAPYIFRSGFQQVERRKRQVIAELLFPPDGLFAGVPGEPKPVQGTQNGGDAKDDQNPGSPSDDGADSKADKEDAALETSIDCLSVGATERTYQRSQGHCGKQDRPKVSRENGERYAEEEYSSSQATCDGRTQGIPSAKRGALLLFPVWVMAN